MDDIKAEKTIQRTEKDIQMCGLKVSIGSKTE